MCYFSGTDMQLSFVLLKIYPLNPILSDKSLTFAFKERCVRYTHWSAVSEQLKKQLLGILGREPDF